MAPKEHKFNRFSSQELPKNTTCYLVGSILVSAATRLPIQVGDTAVAGGPDKEIHLLPSEK